MAVSNIEKANQGRQTESASGDGGMCKFKYGGLQSGHEGMETAPLHGHVSSHQLLSSYYALGPFASILSLNPHKTLNYILPNPLDSPENHHFPTLSLNQTLTTPLQNQSSRAGPCPTLKR